MLEALLGAAGGIGQAIMGAFGAKNQYEHQKEFAQNGIRWKVKDAEAAGIHPLYALGAQTTSYAPTSMGGGEGLAEAGQNIGRAIQAGSTTQQRAEALATTTIQLQNEGLKLDNDLKKTQLASAINLATQPGTGPGIPGPFTKHFIPGQGNSAQWDPQHREQNPQFTPHVDLFGTPLQSHPGMSDAQTYEDRYGEGADWLVGPFNLGADLYNTFGSSHYGRAQEFINWLQRQQGKGFYQYRR